MVKESAAPLDVSCPQPHRGSSQGGHLHTGALSGHRDLKQIVLEPDKSVSESRPQPLAAEGSWTSKVTSSVPSFSHLYDWNEKKPIALAFCEELNENASSKHLT